MKTNSVNTLVRISIISLISGLSASVFAEPTSIRVKSSGMTAISTYNTPSEELCKYESISVNLEESSYRLNSDTDVVGPTAHFYYSQGDLCSFYQPFATRFGYAEIKPEKITLNNNVAEISGYGQLEIYEVVMIENPDDPYNPTWEPVLKSSEMLKVNVEWKGEGKPERMSFKSTDRHGSFMTKSSSSGMYKNAIVNGTVESESFHISMKSSPEANEYSGTTGYLSGSATSYSEIIRTSK